MADRTALQVIRDSIRPALKSAAWLLAIMVPVSLGVAILSYYGVLAVLARPLEGAFRLIGLPGEAALVFLTSIFLNIYSAIAVMAPLGLSTREVTILALMCLIAHNFFVEITVVRRTGSKPLRMTVLRVTAAVIGAIALNLVMPPSESTDAFVAEAEGVAPATGALGALGALGGLGPVLADWAMETVRLIGTVVGIIVGLMIFTRLLEHFGIIRRISRAFRPVFRILGLPESAAFLWFVANTLGLAYGAAIMIEHVESGNLDRPTADLLNHHLVLSHSLLEDTLLFVAIGVGAGWIIVPRVVLATAAVWAVRILRGSGVPDRV